MVPFQKLTAAFLCVGLGGCVSSSPERHSTYQPQEYHAIGGYSDCKDGIYTKKAAKRAARIALSSVQPCSSDFKEGFTSAYVDLAQGGSGEIPAIPPEKYWATAYRTAAGHEKAQQWFEGYSAGVNSAYSQGLFGHRDVSTSLAGSPYEDPDENLAVTHTGHSLSVEDGYADPLMQQPIYSPPLTPVPEPMPVIQQPYGAVPPQYPSVQEPVIPTQPVSPTLPMMPTPTPPMEPEMPATLPQYPSQLPAPDLTSPGMEAPGLRAPDALTVPQPPTPAPQPDSEPALNTMPNIEAPLPSSIGTPAMPEAKIYRPAPLNVQQTKGSTPTEISPPGVWSPQTNEGTGDAPWQ